ncbi:putative glycoprotein [Wenling crustacean virus 13]|uniref:Putative glycoprotein n=1 Tax=Wenling crustacean virus 13 TaxID=1923482 RepID=A0A1L3KNB5_9VIRU|nr:putative glycoprotein [Wenling crustacean virus 13]APG78829.1 putative glycoprotein [Wenling crustacean virus 13]
MHSHVSIVHGGHEAGRMTLLPNQCLDMHKNMAYQHHGHMVLLDGPNTITDATITVAGSVDSSGWCEGSSFSHRGSSYTSVVVVDTLTIKVKQVDALVQATSGEVHLPNGVSCLLGSKDCYHPIYGMAVIDETNIGGCGDDSHEIIYEGPIEMVSMFGDSGEDERYFVVETPETVFALKRGKKIQVCRENAWSTEHPKLIVIPKPEWGFKFTKRISGASSVHLIPYVNSKIQFLDLKVGQNMVRTKVELLEQICENSRKIVENRLMLAKLFPHQVASLHYNKPGYMGRVSGEALHIIKCKPVSVSGRKAEGCYQGIPVTHKNESWFLLPITRILSRNAVETTCSRRLPNVYLFGDSWWELGPEPRPAQPPKTMTVGSLLPQWGRTRTSPLGFGGLYPYRDMMAYEQALFGPVVTDTGIAIMTRKMTGMASHDETFSSTKLFDQDDMGSFQDSLIEHNWGPLAWMGEILAEGAAVIVCIVLILLLLKLVVRVYKLWRVSGAGPWLLWSILSVFTETYTAIKFITNLDKIPCSACHPCTCHTRTDSTQEIDSENGRLYPVFSHADIAVTNAEVA